MLLNKPFRCRYTTGKTFEPIDFCELALSNSVSLDLGLGYFSSASFNILSNGFARFISNGGIMRLYINQYVTNEDYELLRRGENVDYEEALINSFVFLKDTFSKRDEHFFKCLSFLIQINRIEIKVVVPRNGGIAHEKFGIFKDECDNKVMFTGSMNLTAAALLKNIETIECSCSWKGEDSEERIDNSISDFEDVWFGRNKEVTVFPAKKFCQEILETYPNIKKDTLIHEEQELIRTIEEDRAADSLHEIKWKQELPHFPHKYPDGPRPYQLEACQKWNENGKKGIFAMATGTGKTITSLNCALSEYYKDNYYHILILVPTIALVDQWIEEVNAFSFCNITSVCSENPEWRSKLARLVGKLSRGKQENYVIISTYQSFVNKDFIPILNRLPNDTILIADEAHNIGSPTVRNVFKEIKLERRIALSATPNRIYDEKGTEEIEQIFSDKPPYVYSFPMSKAIQEGRLMEYLYYPKIAYLNEEEMDRYLYYTNLLFQYFDATTGKITDEVEWKKILMERKRVIHKSEDKLNVYRNILREIGGDKLKYCFVYVPEGLRYKDQDDFYGSNGDEDMGATRIIEELLQITKEEYPQLSCSTYTGYKSKKERANLLSSFEQGKVNVLLAMKCLDEGVDVPRAEYGIFTSSTGNPRQFIQRRGRLLRLHKEKLFSTIYDIIVVPNYLSPGYSRTYWGMERGLVKSELSRVAYFANLATNKLSGALDSLNDIASYYELNLAEMIMSIEKQQ